MKKELLDKMMESCMEQKIYNFKENFVHVFTEEFNKVCDKLAKEVSRDMAHFDVVEESISIPLNTPKVKNAEIFAIESDDDNVVVKFKVDGDQEMSYPVPESEKEFYRALEEEGFDSLDDELQEKVSAELSEFVIKVYKKDESIERGDELDEKEIEMEAVDMSKLTGAARLKAIKDMAEKKKLEASKKANEENDSEMSDDVELKEESKKKRK